MMETKREVMERYDAAQDDKPAPSPDCPNVHEIAAMLLASLWQSDDVHTSIDDCYRAAQTLYEAGAAWEKRQHKHTNTGESDEH